MKRICKKYFIQIFHLELNKKEWRFIFAAVRNAESYQNKMLGNAYFKELLSYIPWFEQCMKRYVRRKWRAYQHL